MRGMWKHAFVFPGPHQIARVEITAARLAAEKMLGLTNAPTIGALAEHRPARSHEKPKHHLCNVHDRFDHGTVDLNTSDVERIALQLLGPGRPGAGRIRLV